MSEPTLYVSKTIGVSGTFCMPYITSGHIISNISLSELDKITGSPPPVPIECLFAPAAFDFVCFLISCHVCKDIPII